MSLIRTMLDRLLNRSSGAQAVDSLNYFKDVSARLLGNYSIGKGTMVSKNAHIAGIRSGIVVVGESAYIGESANVLSPNDTVTKIANQTSVMNGAFVVGSATIEKGAVVGVATKVVRSNMGENSVLFHYSEATDMNIPAGELWAGKPAKHIRKLTDEEISRMAEVPAEINAYVSELSSAPAGRKDTNDTKKS
mmetsp:Transcript_1731/g.5234  ORF Transcript_1731/g.5234 Transcript_1731/m.5234 type:complete len:192 (+) Transcript_1731:201-776(+)